MWQDALKIKEFEEVKMQQRTIKFIMIIGVVIIFLGVVSFLSGVLSGILNSSFAYVIVWGGIGVTMITFGALLAYFMLVLKYKPRVLVGRNGKILATYMSVAPYHCPLDHDSDKPGSCPRCGLPLQENQNSSVTKAEN
jgi:hypothetical protein